MPSRVLRLASALLMGLTAGQAALAAPSACFTAADNRALTNEIYQQAPPPERAAAPGYAFYPATAVATQNLNRLWESRAPLAKYYFQWANRANLAVRGPDGKAIPRKANFQPGPNRPRELRTDFTSIDKADACTLAQTAAVLGSPKTAVERLAKTAGVSVVQIADDSPGLAGAVDVCVVQTRGLPDDAAGVLLDYEVQDGRSPAQSLTFLQTFAELVHAAGRKAILFTNPLDAPTQAYTGLTSSNSAVLAKLFDRMTILLWAGNAQHDVAKSFETQMDIINRGGPVDPRRIIAVFELAGTTQEDARTTRALIIKHNLAGAMFWRNRVAQGGDCEDPVNKKIACVALGHCQ